MGNVKIFRSSLHPVPSEAENNDPSAETFCALGQISSGGRDERVCKQTRSSTELVLSV